jgi:Ca2+-binding EF-hand superfamily protein
MPIDPEEFEQLTEAFDYNDADKDGCIELDEFLAMLRDLEAEIEPREARVGFREIDTDGDGVIELDEFVDWWTER